MLTCLLTAWRRHLQAREARRNEKRNAELTRQRDARNGYHRHAIWAFIALGCLALVGCHGAERATRTALDVAAHAVDATDVVVAPIYRERAAAALDASISLDDYRERMRTLDRTETALRVAHEALLAAESGLDAHGAGGVLPTIGCVALALTHLVDALAAAGIQAPFGLARAVAKIGELAGGLCPEPPPEVDHER